jgi:hypothetical protein
VITKGTNSSCAPLWSAPISATMSREAGSGNSIVRGEFGSRLSSDCTRSTTELGLR